MSMWLVTVAMFPEAKLLTARLEPGREVGRRPCWRGSLAGHEVLLLLTGIGQVSAAQATTAALEAEPAISAVFNLGCAGAYAGSGLQTGQAALASEVVLADMGVQSGDKLQGLDEVDIALAGRSSGLPLYNRIPCDPGLNELVLRANPGITLGAFATVGRISGDAQTAQAVAGRWGAIMEEMESAAVGLVARWYAKPFAAIRGVSNPAGLRELDVAAGAGSAERAFLALDQSA
ncbi:MAG: futalosine hydrolase [Desulfarculaceae bacterium]|nr:futalosine hydrolase [Desulfarculaceae bacterium]MCF8047709.1 futalosine hydrolase [Desulfarculaceae bacterium]MCF8065705.1 futalosine hydrolase [Desulfarculaceae bacterium]MCF8096905.1 futalosine hydrolase [Desulfarculaceae bacterium]MCF8120884.1 futalosine hydrolase [Desulfarculaceae bacterium]